jgi:NADH-quinone oxidoreductase subunit E
VTEAMSDQHGESSFCRSAGDKIMFSNTVIESIRKVRQKYPDPQGAVLPALHIIQKEYGHLSYEAMRFVSHQLRVPESDVFGTATFYSLYRWKSPGRHQIQICHNLSCSLLGAESLVKHLEKKLGVGEGDVTADGRFSFIRMECIGRCDGAPAMLVDDDYHGNLTPDRIDEILNQYA